jgi:hypothetical protein
MALCPQKELRKTKQNTAAGLTVIPNKGLQEVLPAVAGKLEQMCMLMSSTFRVTKLGFIHILFVGQNSIAVIVTHYGLDSLGTEPQ